MDCLRIMVDNFPKASVRVISVMIHGDRLIPDNFSKNLVLVLCQNYFMKQTLFLIVFLGTVLMHLNGFSQTSSTGKYVDATFGIAKYQGTFSLSYVNTWRFGSKQKLGIGLGVRFTTYLAANQYYVTAPAKLTSGGASPLIIFQDNINANIDTFLIKLPQVNSINLGIYIDYKLSKKIAAGFNIDAIGFSFGGSRTGNYINGTNGKMLSSTPTPFNILLISDNDRGSLNSEFYFKYFLNNKWGLKVGTQFLFTEYTTETKVQRFPQENDRFRNKSLLLCLGVSRKI